MTDRSEPGPARAGMPRWVKVSLLIVAGLAMVFVVLQLSGVGGDHGPGRHLGPTETDSRTHAPMHD